MFLTQNKTFKLTNQTNTTKEEEKVVSTIWKNTPLIKAAEQG